MANEIATRSQVPSIVNLSEAEVAALRTPEGIREKLQQLYSLAINTKEKLVELQSAGVWARIMTNNTRELAQTMGNLLYLQCIAFDMLYMLIRCNANNIHMINAIKTEVVEVNDKLLRSAETDNGNNQNIMAVRGAITSMTGILDDISDRHIEQRRQSTLSMASFAIAVVALVLVVVQWFVHH